MDTRISGLTWILAAVCLAAGTPALAQTADEIVEKHLAATGGREALSKLESRVATGTLTVTTPVGDLMGTVETYAKLPNKSRTVAKISLAAFGGGEVLSDQRFDGTTGYVVDTFNGNRDVDGSQLEALRNGYFPTPLLNYRDRGFTVELVGKQPADGRDAYVLKLIPKSGPTITGTFDAETFMLVKTSMTINVPQLGGDIEQVIEFSDFREVDGIKLAHGVRSTNVAQTITATLTEVTHNVAIDDASFAKP